MPETPGMDTFLPVTEEAKSRRELSYASVLLAQVAQLSWADTGLGVLPVCCACKEAVVWHDAGPGGCLFHCPRCGKRWLKNSKWDKDKAANAAAKEAVDTRRKALKGGK